MRSDGTGPTDNAPSAEEEGRPGGRTDTGADGTQYPHTGFRLKSGREGTQSVQNGCDPRYRARVPSGGARWHRQYVPRPHISPLRTRSSPETDAHTPFTNTLTALTLVLGFLAFISSFFHSFHLLSSWAGLAGLALGGWGQFISATTRERFGLIIGMGAAGIGLLVGMAHGGLFGGVIGG
ncbi:hypothetical protein GA0115252_138726 [Streptomyces sp. DfronAA-171]|nr:hypothetical protein GA0115252_138726 [Streptomyces sp. DfronAA-171]